MYGLLQVDPQEQLPDFRKQFLLQFQKLKETEANKSIDDALSPLCEPLQFLLELPRPSRTSADQRKNLRSQAGNRQFRFSTGFQKPAQEEPIDEEEELNDIIHSYKVEEALAPRTRMKWRTPQEQQRQVDSRESSTIGNNNIDLLSYAIPEIENSIRRLSLQRSPQSLKDRELDIYRTLDSRSHKKKYIPRLF